MIIPSDTTGGDIDLEKSQWSLLSWSYDAYWGLPTINSNEQSKGDLIMTSPLDTLQVKEKLSRLEPKEADRVLGVCLPLDRSMTVEYNFRAKQTKDFALKLKTHLLVIMMLTLYMSVDTGP